jgi:hypothetical protein
MLWSQNPTGQKIFSPDGTLFIYGTSEWIRIYDGKEKKLIKQIDDFIAPPDKEGTLAISKDNQRLMLLQNSLVKIIDIDGKEIFSTPADGEASLSPDGHSVAVLKSCKPTGGVLADCETNVYDVDSGQQTASYPGEHPAYSPGGEYLLVTQGNYVSFRQVSDGKIILELTPDNYLNQLDSWKFSPDGSSVIVIHGVKTIEKIDDQGEKTFIRQKQVVDIVSISDGKLLNETKEFVDYAFVSPNNQYLAIIHGSVKYAKYASDVDPNDVSKEIIYDLTDGGKEISNTPLPSAIHMDQISGIDDHGNLTTSPKFSDLLENPEEISNVSRLTWKEGTLQFYNQNNPYNAPQLFCQVTPNGESSCQEQDGFLASDGNVYEVKLDAQNITLLRDDGNTQTTVAEVNWKYEAYNKLNGGTILGYVPGKDFLAIQVHIGSNSSKVIIVDLAKEQIIYKWDWDEVAPDITVMSPSADYMAWKISGSIYNNPKIQWEEGVFDFSKGWFVWHGGSYDSSFLAFSPDEKYLLEIQDRNGVSMVYLYDFIRREQVTTYEMQPEFNGDFGACVVNGAAISADNQMAFYACQDGTILVNDLVKGKKITRWQAFNEPVTSISLSADSTRLTASAGGIIKVWDAQ